MSLPGSTGYIGKTSPQVCQQVQRQKTVEAWAKFNSFATGNQSFQFWQY